MPHDKVNFCPNEKDWKYQAMVELESNKSIKDKEIQVPIEDPLISEGLTFYKNFLNENHQEIETNRFLNFFHRKNFWINQKKSVFLPTICLKMLKHLRDNINNHHIIIADFDSLKSEKNMIQAVNAPIVSKKLKKSHEKYDFDTYLVKQGEADIFFPTNFYLLKNMYLEICKKKCLVMKSHEFINEFAKEKWAETRSGYNPLKEDFLNTSILITEI